MNFGNLAIKGGGGGWGESQSCSLNLGHIIFRALPILYIAEFKERKMDKFIPDRKISTIIVFDKPISNRFSPNISSKNMVSFHPLSLTMKYRLEKFVVKFLCSKVFGRFLFS